MNKAGTRLWPVELRTSVSVKKKNKKNPKKTLSIAAKITQNKQTQIQTKSTKQFNL